MGPLKASQIEGTGVTLRNPEAGHGAFLAPFAHRAVAVPLAHGSLTEIGLEECSDMSVDLTWHWLICVL